MKKPKLIIIMGQPGTGKTTIAYKLSTLLEIDQVLNTDILRTILRSVYNEDTFSLLYTVTHEAWKLYGDKSSENIYKAFLEHCIILYPYIKNIINKSRKEGRDLIIEGAHILPHNYNELDIHGFDVYPIYLSVPENEQLKERYNLKNKKRNIKEKNWLKNFEIIRFIERKNLTNLIKSNNGVIVLDNDSLDKNLERCIEVIK